MINDMYSLLAWAKEEELKAHNTRATFEYTSHSKADSLMLLQREKDFREMVDRIEKSPTELHRTLTMPREFDPL
jgi:hypothetical protein